MPAHFKLLPAGPRRRALWTAGQRARLLKMAVLAALIFPYNAPAFEGRINAVMTQAGQTDTLLYTVDTNFLRVEITATPRPNAVDILDRNSGGLTLLFPNNRGFVHLEPADETATAPGAPETPMPSMSNLPPGVGPPSAPGVPTMPAMPGVSGGMSAMPMMPPPPMKKIMLQDTGQKTNLLGFTCEHYEIKRRGGTMEIWATDQLFPFQPYLRGQPHRFDSRRIETEWAELVKAKKLFPLLATLKFDNGMERFRFEVKSVLPQKLTDEDAQLFQPPPGYAEIQPLAF
jgi:uncharacterized protein DUF4412